jgi:hypothetical protein
MCDANIRRHCIGALLCLVTGCGDLNWTRARYPVTGQVLLADGNPLAGVSVQLVPTQGELPASGTISSDGTFIQVGSAREGAALGEYKVRIEPSALLRAINSRKAPKHPFASMYREYDGNTGLTATTKAQATQLEHLRLERD